MRCPECNSKITTKDYDATYEWYECGKCEGVFTFDEVIEGGQDESVEPEATEEDGNRSRAPRKKAAGSRGAQRTNAKGKNGRVSERDAEIRRHLTQSGVEAKGKKRRTEIQEDEDALAEHEKEMLKPVKQDKGPTHHRDEIETRQVVNIWGDEIQDIYAELGGPPLDEINAQDKALILWRELHAMHGVSAREQKVSHAACKEHK